MRTRRRSLWWCALAGALSALLLHSLAHAQTIPLGLCGLASVASVKPTCVTTGCGTASFSVTNTPSSPTLPVISSGSVVGAVFTVTGNPINVTTDGTAPTALVGQSYGPGSAGGAMFVSCGSDLQLLKWVAASPSLGNGTVNAIFYTNGR